jgi:hypothetical protein
MPHDKNVRILSLLLAGLITVPLQAQWDWTPEKRQLSDGDYQASPFIKLFRKTAGLVIGYEVVIGGGYCFRGTWERGEIMNEVVFDLAKYHDTGKIENAVSRRPTIAFPIVQEVVPLQRERDPFNLYVGKFEECLRILGASASIPPKDDCTAAIQPRRRPADLRSENRDWLYIRQSVDSYRDRAMSEGRDESFAIFSRQLQNLVELSIKGREESEGAWSGDLARRSLLFIAHDLEANPAFGMELAVEGDGSSCADFAPIVNRAGVYCRALRLGQRHLKTHVTPFFREYVKERLLEVVRTSCQSNLRERIINELGRIRTAHVLFIDEAVVPGFRMIPELNDAKAILAAFDIRGEALQARLEGSRLALETLVATGVIDSFLSQSITKTYLMNSATDVMLPKVPEYDHP